VPGGTVPLPSLVNQRKGNESKASTLLDFFVAHYPRNDDFLTAEDVQCGRWSSTKWTARIIT